MFGKLIIPLDYATRIFLSPLNEGEIERG